MVIQLLFLPPPRPPTLIKLCLLYTLIACRYRKNGFIPAGTFVLLIVDETFKVFIKGFRTRLNGFDVRHETIRHCLSIYDPEKHFTA